MIANNATSKGNAIARGAARHGELPLAGLLRCGHCSRKMYVAYGGKAGRYHCEGALVTMAPSAALRSAACGPMMPSARRCCGKPLGIDAAVKALDAQAGETSAAKRQLELQQAPFEAAHARRQYDAIDPTNRLVAGELERRWNEARQVVHRIEREIAAIEARKPAPLREVKRQQLMQPGADLALAWSHPATTSATRKRIVRAALSEIVVRVEAARIRDDPAWAGRRPCPAEPKKNRAGKHRWTIPEDTLSLVRELARLMPDRQIARLAIAPGRATLGPQARVCSFPQPPRHYRPSRKGSEITLAAAAQSMDVSVMTSLRMVRHGIIKGRQVRPG